MIELTRKERMHMDRTGMPERPAGQRAHTFEEVNLGYSWELAQLEAARCIECRRPPCVDGCPVGVRIDEFVIHVAAGRLAEAANVIAADNLLPAICGRVCPQENQCEGTCVLGRKGKPIAIGHLERFVADHTRTLGTAPPIAVAKPSGRSVAIVGSGPAGLACAADLAKAGHAVTVMEALHEPGGVLTYGIPEYRLPQEIVEHEVDGLEQLGVRFETNVVVGRTVTLARIREDYDAVFLGVGAGLPRFLEVPGDNLIGVYSANEFLTRVNLMRAYEADSDTPVFDVNAKRVAVFGGGNTAMDAVRTARRLGAADARILYRRSGEELPAREEEVRHAVEEGVAFDFLVSPIELLGVNGWLTGARLQRMELGDPDESGRRRPKPIEGDLIEVPVDMAVVAIGNAPNPLLLSTVPELEQTARGTLAIDEETGATSLPGVFAGGDIVTGGATVISAMGAARKAAAAIDAYLSEPALT
jgi:glutamate synthase (NADPH/NADH) small chain